VIPEDWRIARLAAVCDVRDGTHESPEYYDQGVTFVTSKNIVEGRLDLDNVSYISHEDAVKFDQRSKVNRGDILMSMIGTIGNSVLVDFEPDFCIKNVALIKPRNLNARYLIQLFNSPMFQEYLDENLEGGIQKFIALGTLRKLAIPLPPLPEQRAIAAALSDVDTLIAVLGRLIAKKRAIKHGAMQQILTGQTRLPGFSDKSGHKQTEMGVIPKDWGQDRICNHASITTGTKDTKDKIDDGKYPFFVRSPIVERINSYSFDGEAVLTAGDGVGTGKVFHYTNGKFDFHQRVYRISDFSKDLDGHFFYLYFSTHFYNRIMSMTAKSSVDSVRMEMIADMIIPLPPLPEQRAIATVLSDMDAEITALEARREKTRTLKQGMMQELLTGRIRLVGESHRVVATPP
jgi:type I restriction enzyme S subunit